MQNISFWLDTGSGSPDPDIDLTFSLHTGYVNLGQSSIMPDQLKLGVGLKKV